jgi:hypothetical protein
VCQIASYQMPKALYAAVCVLVRLLITESFGVLLFVHASHAAVCAATGTPLSASTASTSAVSASASMQMTSASSRWGGRRNRKEHHSSFAYGMQRAAFVWQPWTQLLAWYKHQEAVALDLLSFLDADFSASSALLRSTSKQPWELISWLAAIQGAAKTFDLLEYTDRL